MEEKSYKSLCEAISMLETTEECEQFMRDLCTIGELEDMSDRWEAAQLINKGMCYREINAKTGISTATITRVAHWIHHGRGGYKLMLERMH